MTLLHNSNINITNSINKQVLLNMDSTLAPLFYSKLSSVLKSTPSMSLLLSDVAIDDYLSVQLAIEKEVFLNVSLNSFGELDRSLFYSALNFGKLKELNNAFISAIDDLRLMNKEFRFLNRVSTEVLHCHIIRLILYSIAGKIRVGHDLVDSGNLLGIRKVKLIQFLAINIQTILKLDPEFSIVGSTVVFDDDGVVSNDVFGSKQKLLLKLCGEIINI